MFEDRCKLASRYNDNIVWKLVQIGLALRLQHFLFSKKVTQLLAGSTNEE